MSLKVTCTKIPDVKLIEPKVFEDHRGFFLESFNRRDFVANDLPDIDFVQDNHSLSRRNVLRGLHYQVGHPQGKLVRVLSGEVFDVAVDLRRSSPHFGQWVGAILSASNKTEMWIPPGFAHGFVVLSEQAEFFYKTTDYWHPNDERVLLWNDPAIGITWPVTDPVLAPKDAAGVPLADAEAYE